MVNKSDYDFTGWGTRNNIRCSDGRTIRKDAFLINDGQTVPLVWNHRHDEVSNVLGHALLENRDEGVYIYGKFNDTESGKTGKRLVCSKDITSLSIYANQLKQNGGDVIHGNIREISLVLAGANPGAFIDSVIAHGEYSDEEAIIYFDEDIEICHADDKPEEKKEENIMADEKERTDLDVIDTMNEEQKMLLYRLIGEALNEDNNEEEPEVKHNVFDKESTNSAVLSHSEQEAIFKSAMKANVSSLKDYWNEYKENNLTHSAESGDDDPATFGIQNIDYLFPDAKNVNNTPDFISRDMTWVSEVMNGAKHLPFSRVKSVHANITADEARAKGYVKGSYKTEEVIVLLKRSTSPCTIYKKQKLDRDDLIDIIDFDVAIWLKSEMRMMLNEEIARAALVGDGRSASDDDYINPANIRPIYSDDALYTIRKTITVPTNPTTDDVAKSTIRTAIKARKDYKGSGNPIFFTTEDMLTDMLLLEDSIGHPLYDSVEKLATKLRVRKIVTVPVMENMHREGTGTDAGTNFNLLGIIVNMNDYAFGADKGGNVALFDDFDINYNQQIYLMETRCSGALIKPYSAIVLEQAVAAA